MRIKQVDLCLFVPCFSVFFDLMISLVKQGTHNIALALILQKMNGEIENKLFEELI